MKQAQLQHIVGVVTPLGVDGLREGTGPWQVVFHLQPWRIAGGAMKASELRITCPMSRPQITALGKALPELSVVAMTVRDLVADGRGKHKALLDTVTNRRSDDAELSEAAAAQRAPLRIQHRRFGTLTLDRGIGMFMATLHRGKHPVLLMLKAVGNAPDRSQLTLAESLWVQIADLDKRAREYAASQLLQIKHRHWHAEPEGELTAVQFRARLRLETLSLEGRTRYCLSFAAGTLFAGHSVQVTGSLRGGFTEAKLAG